MPIVMEQLGSMGRNGRDHRRSNPPLPNYRVSHLAQAILHFALTLHAAV